MRKEKYIVAPRSNYSRVEFSNLREAKKYARSITDSTNPSTIVRNEYGCAVAWWRWTPEKGGRTYRAEL